MSFGTSCEKIEVSILQDKKVRAGNWVSHVGSLLLLGTQGDLCFFSRAALGLRETARKRLEV